MIMGTTRTNISPRRVDGKEEVDRLKKDLKTEEINSMVPLMIFFWKLFICHSKNVESPPHYTLTTQTMRAVATFLSGSPGGLKSLSLDDQNVCTDWTKTAALLHNFYPFFLRFFPLNIYLIFPLDSQVYRV